MINFFEQIFLPKTQLQRGGDNGYQDNLLL